MHNATRLDMLTSILRLLCGSEPRRDWAESVAIAATCKAPV